jgi:hypothetical protein
MDSRYWLGLCLLGLCLYSGIVGSQRSYDLPKVVANPITYTDRELKFEYISTVKVLPQEFQVEQLGARIFVQIPENLDKEWAVWRKQLEVGDYVSLRAVFHPEGHLLLHEMHVHKGRRLKVWVSLFALLFLAGLLINERMKVSPRDA